MSGLQISIVIRCYNEEQHIGRLLTGILQQTIKDVEIVIVDSGSTDATLAIASRFPVKIVHIPKHEFTFGRSLNMGCSAACGDIVVIASAHVYPLYDDWFEQLLSPFSDPFVAIVYGKQEGNEVTKYSEKQIFSRWFPSQSNFNQLHPFCNNANAAIRRSLWEKIQYDEMLTGLEDIDWAKRIIGMGYKVAYSADAAIVHIHEERAKSIYNRYSREAIALKHIFPDHQFHLWDFVRLFVSNMASDYYHAVYDHVLLQNLSTIPVFRLMQFWGTYRGFTKKHTPLDEIRQTLYHPRELSRMKTENKSVRDSRRIDYQQITNETIGA